MKIPRLSVLFAVVWLPMVAAAEVENSANTLRLAEGAASPAAKVDDFAWLAGHWVGTGFGGAHVEEVWLPPLGRIMSGHFRLVARDRVGVFEVFALVEVGETVELRLKHFTRELKGGGRRTTSSPSSWSASPPATRSSRD